MTITYEEVKYSLEAGHLRNYRGTRAILHQMFKLSLPRYLGWSNKVQIIFVDNNTEIQEQFCNSQGCLKLYNHLVSPSKVLVAETWC